LAEFDQCGFAVDDGAALSEHCWGDCTIEYKNTIDYQKHNLLTEEERQDIKWE
jgi:hypothetical protein